MSIVFFGTGEFAVPLLEAVKDFVSLVVTQPDRPSGRGMRLRYSPVKRVALDLGLTVATPDSSRTQEFMEQIKRESPEFLLVASYGQILPLRLLETGTHGGINLHGSILPKYRGAAPIQRAILNGEGETGVTLMQMEKGMDTGGMIDIVRTAIEPDETYGELQTKLANLAARQLKEWLPRLRAGKYEVTAQDHDKATVAPKVTKDEAELHFENDVQREYDRFRAFTPSPGAFVMTRFGRLRLARVRLSQQSGDPGTVRVPNLVALKGGSLELLEIQREGKGRMSGADFFNGSRLRSGDSLLTHAT